MKNILIILPVFCLFWLINSCSEDSLSPAKPKINSLSSDNTVVGDTIAVSGEHFTYNSSVSKLVFSSGQLLTPNQCLKWNNNYIRLVIPKGAGSGSIMIVSGNDTSNKVNISITTIPPIEMLEIQPDSFDMGSVNGFKSEQPVHKVVISKSFLIGKYEINQRTYESVIGSNPSITKGPNLPVHNLSWSDAVNFCNKLSESKGLSPFYIIKNDTISIDSSSFGYRLPTEAEWEFCCKAKKLNDFSGTGILDEMGWYSFNSAYYAHNSGTKKANDFGLYDTHGNVWEWCWDFFGENYYSTSPKINPSGPKNGKVHVLRGGSFIDGAAFCRSSNRTYPYTTFEYCGLRVVRTKENK